MQDTFSPIMGFSKLFLVQEHLFKENVTILCINANFTRDFALVWWPHWKPLLSRNLQKNVSWNSRKMDINYIENMSNTTGNRRYSLFLSAGGVTSAKSG